MKLKKINKKNSILNNKIEKKKFKNIFKTFRETFMKLTLTNY
jgi:hypothetical protein